MKETYGARKGHVSTHLYMPGEICLYAPARKCMHITPIAFLLNRPR